MRWIACALIADFCRWRARRDQKAAARWIKRAEKYEARAS